MPPVGVVGLLDDGGPLLPVPDLAPEAERLDLQVFVPRPGEHAAGALQQVSATLAPIFNSSPLDCDFAKAKAKLCEFRPILPSGCGGGGFTQPSICLFFSHLTHVLPLPG